MKSARDGITNVQSVRGLSITFLLFDSDSSLTDTPKRDDSRLVLAALDQPVGPADPGVADTHRRDHVDQHPAGEEPGHARLRFATRLLHEPDELAVTLLATLRTSGSSVAAYMCIWSVSRRWSAASSST